MIKLKCDAFGAQPEDCIQAEPLSGRGDVMVSIVECTDDDKNPRGVFLSPEKARVLGLELIRMAGGVHEV